MSFLKISSPLIHKYIYAKSGRKVAESGNRVRPRYTESHSRSFGFPIRDDPLAAAAVAASHLSVVSAVCLSVRAYSGGSFYSPPLFFPYHLKTQLLPETPVQPSIISFPSLLSFSLLSGSILLLSTLHAFLRHHHSPKKPNTILSTHSPSRPSHHPRCQIVPSL